MTWVDNIGEGLMLIVMIFVAAIIIIAMAPILGQLGGGAYEALFVLLAVLVIIAAIAGYSRRF